MAGAVPAVFHKACQNFLSVLDMKNPRTLPSWGLEGSRIMKRNLALVCRFASQVYSYSFTRSVRKVSLSEFLLVPTITFLWGARSHRAMLVAA